MRVLKVFGVLPIMMDFSQYHYYKVNEKLLRCLGMWPYQNKRNARIRRIIVFLILWSMLLSELYNLRKVLKDLEAVIDLVADIMIFGNSVICTTVLYTKLNSSYNKPINIIFNNWGRQTIKEEIKIKESFAKRGRNFTLFMMFYSYGIITPAFFLMKYHDDFISDLSEKNQRISNNTVNKLTSKFNFFLVISKTACIIIALTIIVAHSSVVVISVFHVSGNFSVIKYRLKNIFDYSKRDKSEIFHLNLKNNKILLSCIKIHCDCLYHIRVLSLQFEMIQMIATLSIIICLAASLVTAMDFDKLHLKSQCFSCGLLLFYSILCYVGQVTTDNSVNIGNIMYNTKWYNAPVKTQKMLLLIIQQSYTFRVCTAATFAHLTLENLIMLLKTAVSYCIFLRRFQ